MLDANSSTYEVLDAILKDKTAEEQIKILRELYGDAVGHGWVDDELRDNILASACRDYDVEYNAVEEEDDDDDDYDKNEDEDLEEDDDDDLEEAIGAA